MRILAIEPNADVCALYWNSLTKRKHEVTVLREVDRPISADLYDVVIVSKEETKTYITNLPFDHIIVASSEPTAKANGTWALTKPFHMAELAEILDVISGTIKVDWKKSHG